MLSLVVISTFNSFVFSFSKRKLLALWLEKFPELTFVFSELSCMPESVTDSSVDAIEQYWVAAYDSQKKFGICGLNDLRFLIFNSSAINDLRRLPPTRDSLRQHGTLSVQPLLLVGIGVAAFRKDV